MKKILIVLILALNCSASDYIDGEANFLSKDGDSLSFIKKQLISNAFKKVFDKELKELDLDYTTFWDNYNAKFDEYFLKIKKGIDEKYVDKETGQVPASKKDQYERYLRRKRLSAKTKYGRLSRAIKSYSIKKISKSVTMRNSHYLNLTAVVNKKALTDIYYKFIGVSSLRTFRTLYLDVDYKLVNTNWLELGVESEKDFVDVVSGHWRSKLEASVGHIFTNGLVFVNDEHRARINKRMKMSSEVISAVDVSTLDESQLELNNSLFMRVDVIVTKEGADDILKKIDLIFNGGMIVTDLKDNSIVTFHDFVREKSSFSTLDSHTLSSNIASLVYRLPMPKIQMMRKIVEENVKMKKRFSLLLKGTKSADEAYSFIKTLKEKGVLYYFDGELISLRNDEARLDVQYSGDKEKALNVLTKMISLKLPNERVIHRDGELPFVFTIKDTEQKLEESTPEQSKQEV
jgi:hypothetical protein